MLINFFLQSSKTFLNLAHTFYLLVTAVLIEYDINYVIGGILIIWVKYYLYGKTIMWLLMLCMCVQSIKIDKTGVNSTEYNLFGKGNE